MLDEEPDVRDVRDVRELLRDDGDGGDVNRDERLRAAVMEEESKIFTIFFTDPCNSMESRSEESIKKR